MRTPSDPIPPNQVSTARLKDQLSTYLAYVERGGRVTVYSRDRPVAMLVPVTSASADAADAGPASTLARLEREGVVSRPTAHLPEWLFAPPTPPGDGAPTGVLAALLAEREGGR